MGRPLVRIALLVLSLPMIPEQHLQIVPAMLDTQEWMAVTVLRVRLAHSVRFLAPVRAPRVLPASIQLREDLTSVYLARQIPGRRVCPRAVVATQVTSQRKAIPRNALNAQPVSTKQAMG